ncbi:hypothetical protein OTU49_008673 [Cherax quadricarinatus]|uniref:Protein phosphatase 1 regulatory subunit 35 C-terminal domain-containing protein n=1 Tax=Cherax quadricarinatus TaxID=27406 RepID=A0AAW0YDJ9_CHEQU|nr:uncharacterized protein LOC128686995 isoform X2 [Cherax quadricarinatus]
MDRSKKRNMKIVKGGERHIYAEVDANNENITDEALPRLEALQKRTNDQPIVLANTEMRSFPVVPKISQELKALAAQKKNIACCDRRDKRKLGGIQMASLPESASNIYGAPEIHSTLRVGEALLNARQEKPNLSLLVKNKLDSPNTSSKIKRQTAKQVNVSESKAIFHELVSVDVSEEEVAKQLKDLLNLRAATVRPASRPRDSEPQLIDIFDPEEYVTTTTATNIKNRCCEATLYDAYQLRSTEC